MNLNELKEIFQKTRENIITSEWRGLDTNTNLKDIHHLNMLLKNNNFDLSDYEYYQKLLNFMCVPFNDNNIYFDLLNNNFNTLSDIDKNNLLLEIDDLFKHNMEKIYSIILFSNPNSGKTKYLHSLIEKFPKFNLSLKNTKNPTEWQEKIYVQNINGESFFGPILKMIANSTINNEIPHFIYEDEVGEFELDFVLGQTIKGIFKTEQRLDINNIVKNNSDLKNKIEEIKSNKKITLQQYIDIGNLLKNKFSYEITYYKYNNIEIPLWLPTNLYFIFTSNYEVGMAKSLHDSKGWSNKGKRFYQKHLYNCGSDIVDTNIVQIKANNINKVIIDFNNNFIKNSSKILELDELSPENKEDFKLRIYEFLVPNFYPFNSNNELEQKNELNERIKTLFYEFGVQDIELIAKIIYI